MIRYQGCPVCSSENTVLHLVCRDHFVTGEKFSLYRCAACRLVFTQDHPPETEMPRYYRSEDYISHSDTSEGIANKLYKTARNIMLERKRKSVQSGTGLRKGNILDVGCGTGYFAAAMKNAGWQVKGIEIDEKARQFAASKFGLDVLHPDGMGSLPPQSFDCITLWHVLEHFHDPFGYLSQISRLLKPGGLCIAALPNCSSYDAEYYKSFWAAYDVPRHLWHFQPSSFDYFIRKAGYRCEGIKTLPFDSFYISVMSEKYKGSGMAFLKGMFRGKIFFLKSVFNIRKSSSLVYLLRYDVSGKIVD